MYPARVTLPKEMKRFVLIDRSQSDQKKNKTGSFIEGVLTGESPFADRLGAKYCVDGFRDLANSNVRLEIANAEYIQVAGSGSAAYTSQLSWEFVDSICNVYDADGIVSLDYFDSDDPGIGLIGQPFNYNDAVVTVKSRWKIYYADSSQIIDEQALNTNWRKALSINRFDPLPPANRAVAEAGYLVGYDYGRQIVPALVWENRKIYTGGNSEMKVAGRRAIADNWPGAEELWVRILASSNKRKVLRRASFNLAVANEMKGDIGRAIEYARQSYEDHRNNEALNYYRYLQGRLIDQQIIDDQLAP